MFGLNVIRHRLFEINPPLYFPPLACGHQFKVAKQGRAPIGKQYCCVVGNCAGIAKARKAMQIDWMNRDELAEAIPPAYTKFIGRHLAFWILTDRIRAVLHE
jgi:DNA (cytosine-5)-methyltransferase 1